MTVWVVCTGEVLPIDPGRQRLLRAGTLCSALRKQGHDVVWWTSTFNHTTKRHRFPRSTVVTTGEGVQLRALHGCAYNANVSLLRLKNHYDIAKRFRREAQRESVPGVIVCAWPTIELGLECVRYGRMHGVPVVLDVRDLWPDVFLDAAPRVLRPVARIALDPYFRATRKAFGGCSGIVGISEDYLKWGLRNAGRQKTGNDAVFELGYQEPAASESEIENGKEDLRRLGVDETRTVCWFLGTFGDTYDLQPVLDCARALKTGGNSTLQIVLSGDGDRRKFWEGAASGLDNVIFTGWLSGPRIASMMRMARVGIAAYRKGAPQGLPNKIFEYMAGGLPILSSLGSECRRLLEVNGCGVSYTPGDARGLLDALLALTTDENRRLRLGANALRAFKSRYSASVLYPRLVGHLERIAAGAHSGPLPGDEVGMTLEPERSVS